MFCTIARTRPDMTITIKDGWAIVPTPWRDEFFLEGLKAAVPAHHRWWDRDAKAWNVSARYLDTLVQLVTDWYNEPEVVRAELREAA